VTEEADAIFSMNYNWQFADIAKHTSLLHIGIKYKEIFVIPTLLL
jgi:hypothetical protein